MTQKVFCVFGHPMEKLKVKNQQNKTVKRWYCKICNIAVTTWN